MLRTLVSLLMITTPLLSQDLLVDSIDREFSGTLIEITDTDIIFQIQGETAPVQYPFWAVKRVTLADGSLAFEDGKTYVAKPTLPVEAKPSEPAPQPAPAPEPAVPELAEPEPVKTEVAAGGAPPVFSETALMTMAQNNAKMNHNTAAWGVGGGLLGCGGMYLGAIMGADIAGFPGFIIGATAGTAGGILVVNRLVSAPAVVPIPEKLELADPELREKYHQLYRAEARELRKRSVYRGVLSCAAIPATCVGFVMLSILLSW